MDRAHIIYTSAARSKPETPDQRTDWTYVNWNFITLSFGILVTVIVLVLVFLYCSPFSLSLDWGLSDGKESNQWNHTSNPPLETLVDGSKACLTAWPPHSLSPSISTIRRQPSKQTNHPSPQNITNITTFMTPYLKTALQHTLHHFFASILYHTTTLKTNNTILTNQTDGTGTGTNHTSRSTPPANFLHINFLFYSTGTKRNSTEWDFTRGQGTFYCIVMTTNDCICFFPSSRSIDRCWWRQCFWIWIDLDLLRGAELCI